MSRTTTLVPLFTLLLLPCLCLEAKSAPAPDEVVTAKEKLATLKKKLPELVRECVGNEKLWPVKFKSKVSFLRMISPNEAKMTIRLEYVPPETTDTPAPAAGGGGRGGAGGFAGPGRNLQSPNQVVFIYLKYYDGAWTTSQSGTGLATALQNGINHLMAAIDEVADQEAGK